MRGMIAVGVIAVVVAGVLVLRSGGSAVGSASNSAGPVLLTDQMVIECGQPKTFEDKASDGSVGWRIKEISETDTIRYIDIERDWITNCGLAGEKGTAGVLPGKASYSFSTTRDDKYYLSLRAQWSGTCWNSIWVRIDDSDWFKLQDQLGEVSSKNYRWAWHPLFLEGRPKAFDLKKGDHTLWLNTRHDGIKLHQVVISTDANPPVGGAVKK